MIKTFIIARRQIDTELFSQVREPDFLSLSISNIPNFHDSITCFPVLYQMTDDGCTCKTSLDWSRCNGIWKYRGWRRHLCIHPSVYLSVHSSNNVMHMHKIEIHAPDSVTRLAYHSQELHIHFHATSAMNLIE
jgi:hypothetical protein